MRAKTEDTLMKVGLVGALLAGAYLIWNYFLKAGGSTILGICPAGQHMENPASACTTMTGLPKVLCDIGAFTIGAGSVCVVDTVIPHVELPRDEHGCLVDTQQWCSRDNQCRDIAMACTPEPSTRPSERPECYEWNPRSGTWQWSDSYCPYIPTPAISGRTKPCPDGSYIYPDETCPVYIAPVAKKSCTCNGIIHELSEVEAASFGACGNYCDSLIPTNIVNCSCGKIDLNNPPGTTCESACATAALIPVPTPGIVCQAGMANILAMGHRMGGSMAESACLAMGGKIREGGRCENDAEHAYQEYIRACGSCGTC